MTFEGAGLESGIQLDFEGIARAQAEREAVKDGRRGPSSSDDGQGSLSWHGVAVAVREDRLIPECESMKGPA